MRADRERWDRRWTDVEAPDVLSAAPDVVAVHPGLLDQLPTTGGALDVACGLGAQSIWMAQRGLRVTALDVSPVAIDVVRQRAGRFGVDVDARVVDTDGGLPAGLRDLAMIVCQRYRVPDFYGEFVARLATGGVLVLTVLSSVGLDGHPGAFHAPPGELSTAFDRPDLDVLVDEEREGQASVVVRKLARE